MDDPTWERALVTGASSGIGRAFATELARRGTDLIVVARSADRLADVGRHLHELHGVEVEPLTADLTDPDQLQVVEDRLRDLDRPVDLLVNNAGFATFGRFHELDADTEEAEVALNVTAVVRLTHAAATTMRARGHGGVLNVSSTAGFTPLPFNATYAASKAFVTSFTEALAEELRGSGVAVTVLCPGFTRTEFQDRAGIEGADLVPGVAWMDPDAVARAGLDGLAAGRTVVVPGFLNKVTSAVQRVVPDVVSRRLSAIVIDRFG